MDTLPIITSPHFSNLTLTWWMIAFLVLIGIQLVIPAYFRRNQAALIISVGVLFMALGYLAALLPYYLYPGDLVMIGWFANVVAETVWYAGYACFGLVVITTQFRRISGGWAVAMFILGLGVVSASAYFYQPPTLLASFTYDFHRLFVADFLPFSYGLILAFGLGRFFLSGYRGDRARRVTAWLVTIGTLLVVVPQPVSTIVDSVELKFYLQLVSVFGLVLVLAGLWRGAKKVKSGV